MANNSLIPQGKKNLSRSFKPAPLKVQVLDLAKSQGA